MSGVPVPADRDLDPTGLAPVRVGKRAFESELARIARHITIGGDAATAREASRTLARARHSVEAGDYLQAVEALGRIDLTLRAAAGGADGRPPNAGEVEQALGDVRRLLAEAELSSRHEGGVLLWQAARQAVIDGRWESAMALLTEAREWMADGGP